jgi:AdoMet-dependent heme synthase
MGILHRLYTRHAAEVWQVETRLLHAVGRVRRPLAVQWLVTSACDLHCPHCYSEAGKRVAGELTTDEAKVRVIDELVALGCQNLVLAGGELWLRRDIPELIAYAASRGLAWSMHTHGLHVPRFRELLRKHPPALAAISLDDVGKEHDDFRGRVGSYAGALEAIRILKDTGCPEVVAGTTVTRLNADRLAPLFPVVVASGADSWGLHLFAPEGRGAEHTALVPTPAQLARVAAFARRKRRHFHVELCNEWGSAGDDDWLYRDQPFLCGAGRVSCVVSATGEIMPCTTTDARESEGNVRDVALRDVWATGFGRFRKPRPLPGVGAGDGRGPAARKGRELLWPTRKDGRAVAAAPRGEGDVRAGADELIDEQECWLQSRNGHACSQAAFGPRAVFSPTLLLDKVLSHRLARRFRPAGRPSVVSARGARSLRTLAVATVFLEGCLPKPKPGPAGATPTSTSTSTSSPADSGVPSSRSAPRFQEGDPRAGERAAPLVFPAALETGVLRLVRWQLPNSAWRRVVYFLTHASGSTTSGGLEVASLRRAIASLSQGSLGRGPLASTARAAPTALQVALEAHVDRRARGAWDSPGELLALLQLAEQEPVYDAAFAAYLWQRTSSDEASSVGRRALYERLAAHLQVVSALREAEKRVGPVELSAWRSKAAPPPGAQTVRLPPGFLDAARAALPTAGSADFRHAAALPLRVMAGEVIVRSAVDGGEPRAVGESFSLERLGLVVCPTGCTLAHATLGELVLPPHTEASLFDIPRYLDETARSKLRTLVDEAARGDQRALGELQPLVAPAHRLLRERLAGPPGDPGRAALTMLLGTLDE